MSIGALNDISMRLLEAVKNSNYSYGELSKLTGIPKSAIQRYATGETEKIPLDRLQALAPVLGTTAEHILGWDTQPPVPPPDPELQAKREKILNVFDSMPPDLQAIFLAQAEAAVDALKARDSHQGSE